MNNIKFSGHDRLQLAGVLHYPPGAGPNTPCVVICHGYRGNKEGSGRAVSLAEKLAYRGMVALRFDFSGTGESAGDFADATLSNYILDLSGAVDFVRSVTGGRIGVLGRSFGGTTTICFAAGDDRVDAVCTWAAPVDLQETFIEPTSSLLDSVDEVFTVSDDNDSYLLKRQFFDDISRHDIIAAAAKIAPRPILVVHGTGDTTVPFYQGLRLYEAAREPKEKLFIENGDHRFLEHHTMVAEATLQWLEKQFNR